MITTAVAPGPSVAAVPTGWAAEDKRRILHAVYRVGDIKKHTDFYTKAFGMTLTRQRDVPEEKYTNAFFAFGKEDKFTSVELTYNYGVDSYDIGDGFGHFAIYSTDVAALVERARANGGVVTREAGPVKGGTTTIAFVKDPTGYMWELIQRPAEMAEPLAQIMLRVGDLEKSMAWYKDVLGMNIIRTRDNPDNKYTLAFAGYGTEADSTVIEMTYNYGVSSYPNKGNAYAQVALSTRDVYKTAEAIRAAGGKITREPGPLPGLGTKILACTDPDGYKYVFVDEDDFLKELE